MAISIASLLKALVTYCIMCARGRKWGPVCSLLAVLTSQKIEAYLRNHAATIGPCDFYTPLTHTLYMSLTQILLMTTGGGHRHKWGYRCSERLKNCLMVQGWRVVILDGNRCAGSKPVSPHRDCHTLTASYTPMSPPRSWQNLPPEPSQGTPRHLSP